MTSGSTDRELLDLDALEAAIPHRGWTMQEQRAVLAEVRRLRAEEFRSDVVPYEALAEEVRRLRDELAARDLARTEGAKVRSRLIEESYQLGREHEREETERLRARVAELEAAPPYVPPLLRNAP